jgi:ribosomal protein S18 acetylase RimI-like enzyme
MDKTHIVPLSHDHEEDVLEIIRLSISNNEEIHGLCSLKNTEKNVLSFYKYEVFQAIFNDDPALACIHNETCVGFSCCSTQIDKMYDTKSKIAHGIITIVHPDFRKVGIGSDLRLSLTKELKLRGFDSYMFEIYTTNKASLLNAQKLAKQLNCDADLISFKVKGKIDVF